MIVLQGLYSALLVTQGFSGQASEQVATRGCVHASDAARFRASVSDAAVNLIEVSDVARFRGTVSDEGC